MKKNIKIAISITAHESTASLIDFIKNSAYFVEYPIFIIHINKNSQSMYEEFKSKIKELEKILNTNILLSEERFDTSKESFMLDRAHNSNLNTLKESKIDYDYFMLQASNCLFIKKGIEEIISKYDIGISQHKINEFWQNRVVSHKSLDKFIKIHFGLNTDMRELNIKGCHEGIFLKKDLVEQIFYIVNNIYNLCILENDFPSYPTEEIWFQVANLILQKNNKNIKQFDTITYLPWNRNLNWTIDQVQDAMGDIPYHKFAIKRIERNYNDSIREFIRNKFKY